MILECPTCRARYLVKIGLLAQGGRKVRCGRCKQEWQALLPTNINVFESPPEPKLEVETKPEVEPIFPPAAPALSRHAPPLSVPVGPKPAHQGAVEVFSAVRAGLPALLKKRHFCMVMRIAGAIVFAAALIAWPILDRDPIVKVLPALRGIYEAVGFSIKKSGEGLLLFDGVKSELRYDGGRMWLFVDGSIRNITSEVQILPDIRARALGPDRRVIQSWWVEPPAVTLDSGAEIPFHTQVPAPMQRTIENVYLEFHDQDEKGNVKQ